MVAQSGFEPSSYWSSSCAYACSHIDQKQIHAHRDSCRLSRLSDISCEIGILPHKFHGKWFKEGVGVGRS